MRRVHLRGHTNILKRLVIHTGGFNLGLLMPSTDRRRDSAWVARSAYRDPDRPTGADSVVPAVVDAL